MAQSFQQLFPDLGDISVTGRVPRVDRARGEFLEYKKKKILRFLSEGANPQTAFVLARVYPKALDYWIEIANAEGMSYEAGYDTEMGEYAMFIMDMAEAMAKFSHNLQKSVGLLFGVDSKYGPMYMRFLEAAHPQVYRPGQNVEVKKDVSVTYKVVTTNGDAWKQRALSGTSKRIVQEQIEDEEPIEAEYSDNA